MKTLFHCILVPLSVLLASRGSVTVQAQALKPGSLSPVVKAAAALGLATALPDSTQAASIKLFKSAAAVLAAAALPVSTQAAGTKAKATAVLGFSTSYFLASAPSALGATVIKYYNAAANGFPNNDEEIAPSIVADFCNSKDGQTLCDYADLCPSDTTSTFPGDPKCGETLEYDRDQYIYITLTGCDSGDSTSDIFWSESQLDVAPYSCDDGQGCYSDLAWSKQYYEVFACCSEDSGTTVVTAFCGGDPHFRDYNGNPFNFHGECDLVLVHLPNYRGKPLDLHVRTRMKGFYSIVEAVAIKHGNFLYEFNNEVIGEPKQYINGAEIESLPLEEGPFAITMTTKKNEDYDVDVLIITIHLTGSQDKIILAQSNQWVFVDIEATSTELMGASGLLGSFPGSKKLGRDGTDFTNVDRNTYGVQWQVQAEEPQLFHATPEGHPMAPHDACKLPEVDAHEYLRANNSEFYQIAVEACMKEGMTGMDLDDCVFDVAVLKSPAIAAAWWGSKQVEEEE